MATTVASLAANLRITTDPTAAVPEPQSTLLTQLLAWAEDDVDARAPGARESARDAALTAMVGYVYDRPPAARGNAYSNAWDNSGASHILRRYTQRRGHALRAAGTNGQQSSGQTGGPGVDQVARDAAAANTLFLSTFMDRVRVIVESIVPSWARLPDPPTGQGGGTVDQTARDAAAANTLFLSTFMDRVRTIVESIVPSWARTRNPPAGGAELVAADPASPEYGAIYGVGDGTAVDRLSYRRRTSTTVLTMRPARLADGVIGFAAEAGTAPVTHAAGGALSPGAGGVSKVIQHGIANDRYRLFVEVSGSALDALTNWDLFIRAESSGAWTRLVMLQNPVTTSVVDFHGDGNAPVIALGERYLIRAQANHAQSDVDLAWTGNPASVLDTVTDGDGIERLRAELSDATDHTARDAADAAATDAAVARRLIEADPGGIEVRLEDVRNRTTAIEHDGWVTARRIGSGQLRRGHFPGTTDSPSPTIERKDLFDDIIGRNQIAADSVERGHMRDSSVGEPELTSDVREKLNARATTTDQTARDSAAANAAAIAALPRPGLRVSPEYFVDSGDARTMVFHLPALPAGATAIRVQLAGITKTITPVAGRETYTVALTATDANTLSNNHSAGDVLLFEVFFTGSTDRFAEWIPVVTTAAVAPEVTALASRVAALEAAGGDPVKVAEPIAMGTGRFLFEQTARDAIVSAYTGGTYRTLLVRIFRAASATNITRWDLPIHVVDSIVDGTSWFMVVGSQFNDMESDIRVNVSATSVRVDGFDNTFFRGLTGIQCEVWGIP